MRWADGVLDDLSKLHAPLIDALEPPAAEQVRRDLEEITLLLGWLDQDVRSGNLDPREALLDLERILRSALQQWRRDQEIEINAEPIVDHAARRWKIARHVRDALDGGFQRPAEAPQAQTVIPVFFGTNRKTTGNIDPNHHYGPERSEPPVVELGVCRVNIPPDQRMGDLSEPAWWTGQLRENPRKHVMLVGLDVLTADDFHRLLAERVDDSAENEALVFVHGFKTSFKDALRRTGQLAYDLRFYGAPIAFSWPTAEKLRAYTTDEAAVSWSVPFLERFLEDVAKRSGAKKLHLIAHSMGNRALTGALERIGLKRGVDAAPMFRQVVLAAPDVDVGIMRNLAAVMRSTAERVTLYASSNDEAVKASEKLHGAPRAGSTEQQVLVLPEVDTIDVSPLDTSLIGHFYYGNQRTVVADLFYVIKEGLPPCRRAGMRRSFFNQMEYWVCS